MDHRRFGRAGLWPEHGVHTPWIALAGFAVADLAIAIGSRSLSIG
jgi:hypothetical protein